MKMETNVKTLMISLLWILMLGTAGLGTAGDKGETNMDDKISVWSVEEDALVQSATVDKSDAEWKTQLSPEAYRVIRREGTERAFSGDLWKVKTEGVYRCAACANDLFLSSTKFDSGTGWPSFYAPVHEANIGTRTDRKFFMARTEVHCARCGGHLGHVFDDGPKPTGLRYCMNGVALEFVEMEISDE